MNPVVALVANTSTNRWHPIYYREAPLPGPASDSKPMRHKSGGHHTEGFATRAEAAASARDLATKIVSTGCWTSCAVCLEPEYDIPWDGQDIPADVAFFAIDGTTAKRLF